MIAYLPDKFGAYQEIQIPKYILEILTRVRNKYDYTYRLSAKYVHGRNGCLTQDMSRLKSWAERYHAEVTIKEEFMPWRTRSDKHSGKNVPFIIFEMTDPVAHALERLGLLK